MERLACGTPVLQIAILPKPPDTFGSMETGITTDSPNAVYLFVRNKSTLVFTPNGVQVLN